MSRMARFVHHLYSLRMEEFILDLMMATSMRCKVHRVLMKMTSGQCLDRMKGGLGARCRHPTPTTLLNRRPTDIALVAGEGDTDNAAFTIEGNELRLTAPADYETKPGYSVRVEGTDSDGQKFTSALNISVIDLMEGVAPASGAGTEADPYVIESLDNLVWITLDDTQFNKGNHYILNADIDASTTVSMDSGKGFLPIGNSSKQFRGSFDGGGHTITGLTINRPDSYDVGLFGKVFSTNIKNLILKDCNVTGRMTVGGLVGSVSSGSIEDCHVSGTVQGIQTGGGLAGMVSSSCLISRSSSSAAVNFTLGPTGGLVGSLSNATVQYCYSNGSVIDAGNTSNSGAGGLVGRTVYSSTIKDSYSTASVTSTTRPAGLLGTSQDATTITNSFSAGPVARADDGELVYGLLSKKIRGDEAVVSNSFWDTEATGAENSVAGTGRTTAQMKTQATFTDAGWDFDQVWEMPADSYPRLKWEAQLRGLLHQLI